MLAVMLCLTVPEECAAQLLCSAGCGRLTIRGTPPVCGTASCASTLTHGHSSAATAAAELRGLLE